MQPWFLPKPLCWKVSNMLPHSYGLKIRYYFDDFGCIRCGQKTAACGFNRFCKVCPELVVNRIAFAVGRRQETGAKKE